MKDKECLLKKLKQDELITMCNCTAQGFSCSGSESLMNPQRFRIRINYCLDPDQIYGNGYWYHNFSCGKARLDA